MYICTSVVYIISDFLYVCMYLLTNVSDYDSILSQDNILSWFLDIDYFRNWNYERGNDPSSRIAHEFLTTNDLRKY